MVVGRKVCCSYPPYSIPFLAQCGAIKKKFPTTVLSFGKEREEWNLHAIFWLFGVLIRHWLQSHLTSIKQHKLDVWGLDENKGEPLGLVPNQKNCSNTDRQQG